MQSDQILTTEELIILLEGLDDAQLPTMIQRYHLTLKPIEQLKAYSAEFHATDPERALQIA